MAASTERPRPFICCNHDNGCPDRLVDMSVRKRTRGPCSSAIDRGVSVLNRVSAPSENIPVLLVLLVLLSGPSVNRFIY